MEGSFASERKGVEGCVLSGKLVSVAIERSQTFCSAVHKQKTILGSVEREQRGSGLRQVACFQVVTSLSWLLLK